MGGFDRRPHHRCYQWGLKLQQVYAVAPASWLQVADVLMLLLMDAVAGRRKVEVAALKTELAKRVLSLSLSPVQRTRAVLACSTSLPLARVGYKTAPVPNLLPLPFLNFPQHSGLCRSCPLRRPSQVDVTFRSSMRTKYGFNSTLARSSWEAGKCVGLSRWVRSPATRAWTASRSNFRSGGITGREDTERDIWGFHNGRGKSI